jgi:hypothetical protein
MWDNVYINIQSNGKLLMATESVYTLADKKKSVILLFVLTLLCIADYVLTAYLIKEQYGFDVELNPVLHWLMHQADSTHPMLAFKMIMVGLWWTALYVISPEEKIITLPRIEVILWSMNTVYVLVVAWSIWLVVLE